MPEINHDKEIGTEAREFRAVKHLGDQHVPLAGPNLLRVYAEPELGVAQGAIFTFNVGERPEIVMVLEKLGDRIRVQLARMTDDRVEVFRGENLFSDIENNYMEQML